MKNVVSLFKGGKKDGGGGGRVGNILLRNFLVSHVPEIDPSCKINQDKVVSPLGEQ